MQCELCGKPLTPDTVFLVRIEGVQLSVCASCAKHGEIIRQPQPARTQQKEKPRLTQPRAKKEVIEEIVPDYAERIRKAIQRDGRKLEEIAKSLSMKASTLQAYEQGRRTPSLDDARRLEHAFHIRLIEKIEVTHEPIRETSGTAATTLTLGDMVTIKRRKK